MLPSFAQTNPTSENCQTPLEAMSSILDEPLVESDLGKCVGSGDMATDQKLAVQLKQILDAKGIFIDYEIISDDPNHRNENEEAKQKLRQNYLNYLLCEMTIKRGNYQVKHKRSFLKFTKLLFFFTSQIQNWIPKGSLFGIHFGIHFFTLYNG